MLTANGLIQKDVDKNKRERLYLLLKAQDDLQVQHLLVQQCQNGVEGVLFWINYFIWLYEPRAADKVVPFVTWPYQDEALINIYQHIQEGRDLFIDKTRDMGATWMVLTVFDYCWLFMEQSFLVGSRKAEEVDKLGDLDTLFPKIRYMNQRLPKWMLPNYNDTWMNLGGLAGQSIVGESTNESFGTGGRRKAALLDEFSKWDETSRPAWTSVAQTTPCRIVLATPNGSGTKQAELRETSIDQLHLHWTLHPEKAKGLYIITKEQKQERKLKGSLTRSSWYDTQCERMTEDEIAQELDINYERSAAGRVYGYEWDELVSSGRLKRLEYNPEFATVVWMDFGIGDQTACGIAQISPLAEAIYIIDYHENNNQKIQYYYDWIMSHKDYRGVTWPFSAYYGDIAGNQRNEVTGTSIFEWFLDQRPPVHMEARKTTEIDEKHAVQVILPKTFVDDRLTPFIKAMQNFRYEWDEKKGEFREKPFHDKYSHGPKALAYFAVNHFTPQEKLSSLEEKMLKLQEQSSLNTEYTTS